jgi:hypothetical protein|tara:strand:+ start:311 stop:424 length:114 start_codon:yes stop_codon:yes gene_type:complete
MLLNISLVAAMTDVATWVEWCCFGTDLPNLPNIDWVI